MSETINELVVKDVRFPTSLTGDGSDAMVSIFLNSQINKQKWETNKLCQPYWKILFTC